MKFFGTVNSEYPAHKGKILLGAANEYARRRQSPQSTTGYTPADLKTE